MFRRIRAKLDREGGQQGSKFSWFPSQRDASSSLSGFDINSRSTNSQNDNDNHSNRMNVYGIPKTSIILDIFLETLKYPIDTWNSILFSYSH